MSVERSVSSQPENHRLVSEYWNSPDTGETLSAFFQRLYDQSKGWTDVHFVEWGEKIAGYVPMTQEEIAAAEKRREASRVANVKRKEKQRERDEAQLARLAEKLGREIKA